MRNKNILGIASITAVIKRLLGNELVRQLADTPMSDVMITALPPDRIPTGGDERAQINIYLYQVSPNSSRYDTGRSHSGIAQSGRVPLALDLHYLMSVYGESDLQIEVLLAGILQFFRENSVLTQDLLHSTLLSLAAEQSSAGAHSLFKVTDIREQMDQLQPIKVVPEFLSLENTSKLWSSLQAHSRPAVTYQVSTVFLGDDYDRDRNKL
jgi:hypothetical protein